MVITTTNGKIFEAEWVLETETRNGIQQMTMHLIGSDDPVEIVRELVGQAQIVGIKENGTRTNYEKYMLFRSLISTPNGRAFRLTLDKKQK